MMTFLLGWRVTTWQGHRLIIQPVGGGLEVVVVKDGPTTKAGCERLWLDRRRGEGRHQRNVPLVIVSLHGERCHLFGPGFVGDPLWRNTVPTPLAEHLLVSSLVAPDPTRATRIFKRGVAEYLASPIPGFRWSNLFSEHVLNSKAREIPEWGAAGRKGASTLASGHRGKQLLKSLGFRLRETQEPRAKILTDPDSDELRAVAVLLEDQGISFVNEHEALGKRSPIEFGVYQARKHGARHVVILAQDRIRVFPSDPGEGRAGKGVAETFVEFDLGVLREEHSVYLWLLASLDALRPGGTWEALCRLTDDYATEIGSRLRERIYDRVLRLLAKAVAKARGLDQPTPAALRDTYEAAMLVLFRLLVVAYAEDAGILPYATNDKYRARSLKSKARELANGDLPQADESDSYWKEIVELWRGFSQGNSAWGVPAYRGAVFADDPAINRAGAIIANLALPNQEFIPVLKGLLVDESDGVAAPVDFSTLGFREFGTIYEGLLETELALSQTPLKLRNVGTGSKRKRIYEPCDEDDPQTVVGAGEFYLHDSSGARKTTGSYYTKPFAVDHLLERALVPTLKAHLERIDDGIDDQPHDRQAYELFDFRVADIAMGSGHFLVRAIDKVAAEILEYLARREETGRPPLEGVQALFNRLREGSGAALESVGGDPVAITDETLIRRQVARSCLYGVDINPMAVQLAQVAVWINTFVPGLPLTTLQHHFVCGNSILGIATTEEVKELLRAGEGIAEGLWDSAALAWLEEASKSLADIGRLADADAHEVELATKAYLESRESMAGPAALLDCLVAGRLDGSILDQVRALVRPGIKQPVEPHGQVHQAALDSLSGTVPFHFPVGFPDVFMHRAHTGFDAILGNPPWEKAQIEEHEFWCRHVPGFRGMSQRQREDLYPQLANDRPELVSALEAERLATGAIRAFLMSGAFPGMGSGHPDLYKAFCWRFWNLVTNEGGRIGVVLPRSALAAKGSTEFRKEVFGHARTVEIAMILNNRQWFFEGVHPQYTIGLVALEKRKAQKTEVFLQGPYRSLQRYQRGVEERAAVFSGTEVAEWNDTASLPLLPSEASAEVFAQLRKTPRLDLNDGRSWRARPIQGDLNSTKGKPLMDFSENCPEGFWPVFKGESFDLWNPDTDTYYAWADPQTLLPVLQDTRVRSGKNRRSALSEFSAPWLRDPKTLPCLGSRIAFRRIARATDSRTLRCALVPSKVILTDVAPYVLWPRTESSSEALLLGVLSSLPLDWYSRRFVETHVDFHVFNPLPVPRPSQDDPLRLRAVELAGRLACPDERFAGWAERVGVACGPLQQDEQQDMIHELDAVVAHLYGLPEKHLSHIFETFHEGWDCEERLQATLIHYSKWRTSRAL